MHNFQPKDFNERLGFELAAWASVGLTPQFWWRDDDAVTDTRQLRRLLDLAEKLQIVVGLAVVPQRADTKLVHCISGRNCAVWQHGWGHHFHTSGEFGDGRPVEVMIQDALRGQRALDHLFGPSGWQPVFVPPNHSLAMPFKDLIPYLGYLGLSGGAPLTPRLGHVQEVNAEIDVMDWPVRKILSPDTVCGMVVEALKSRRLGNVPVQRPIGILTHHLMFDDGAWNFVSDFFKHLLSHHPVGILGADRLFDSNHSVSLPAFGQLSYSVAAPDRPASAEVSVVLTSCGRPDLLARTLDSFHKHNSYPIREFIVIEDGEKETPLARKKRFRRYDLKWVCTGKRIGQIAAIDLAYRLIKSPYIFHCEDDWEFIAPGFIEKSLAVLEDNAGVLQVWIRALNDTNGHPVEARVLYAGDVPFRLLEPECRSEEWGTWHGFSFNPGLRRRHDYLLLGSFRNLDPARQKKSYEVEREASEFYLKHGFIAAILADNEGAGYVRHIGGGRRVEQSFPLLSSPHAASLTLPLRRIARGLRALLRR